MDSKMVHSLPLLNTHKQLAKHNSHHHWSHTILFQLPQHHRNRIRRLPTVHHLALATLTTDNWCTDRLQRMELWKVQQHSRHRITQTLTSVRSPIASFCFGDRERKTIRTIILPWINFLCKSMHTKNKPTSQTKAQSKDWECFCGVQQPNKSWKNWKSQIFPFPAFDYLATGYW